MKTCKDCGVPVESGRLCPEHKRLRNNAAVRAYKLAKKKESPRRCKVCKKEIPTGKQYCEPCKKLRIKLQDTKRKAERRSEAKEIIDPNKPAWEYPTGIAIRQIEFDGDYYGRCTNRDVRH